VPAAFFERILRRAALFAHPCAAALTRHIWTPLLFQALKGITQDICVFKLRFFHIQLKTEIQQTIDG
jgi:hypothetical protein